MTPVGTPPAPLNVFGFILTRYCVARCAHCGTSASPDERDLLDPVARDRCLDSLRDLGIGWTIVTGGEPVARRSALRSFMNAAAERGLKTRICTNGFWATDPGRADAVLAELVELGLEFLMLSTDRFHTEFVPMEAVVEAANAAERAGIDSQIAVPALKGDLSSIRMVDELSRLTSAAVFSHPVHPVGRGAELPGHVLALEPVQVEGCGLVGYIEVDTDGTVSACPTSAEFGPSSPMHLGNAIVDDPTEIIRRYQATPWFALLALRGPGGLARLLGDAACLETTEPRRHPCHLCQDLIDEPRAARRFHEHSGIDLLAPVSAETMHELLQRIDQPDERLVKITPKASVG